MKEHEGRALASRMPREEQFDTESRLESLGRAGSRNAEDVYSDEHSRPPFPWLGFPGFQFLAVNPCGTDDPPSGVSQKVSSSWS